VIARLVFFNLEEEEVGSLEPNEVDHTPKLKERCVSLHLLYALLHISVSECYKK
jgi:hypothetical protein